MLAITTAPGSDLSPVLNYLLASGPAGLFAAALFFGWVFSKRAYEELRADRDEWKKAYKDSEEARANLKETVDECLEQSRITNALLSKRTGKKTT